MRDLMCASVAATSRYSAATSMSSWRISSRYCRYCSESSAIGRSEMSTSFARHRCRSRSSGPSNEGSFTAQVAERGTPRASDVWLANSVTACFGGYAGGHGSSGPRARPRSAARVPRLDQLAQARAAHVRVDLGRADVRMTEQFLHRAQVGAALEQ